VLRDDHGNIYAVATTERDLTARLADAVQQAKLDLKGQGILERFEQLTSREREVMRLLVAGSATASTRQIAEQLDISVRTVDTHRRRIREKMDARSMPDLVEKAKTCGIYLPTSD
jgi:FixJ family two-component response regulator